MLLFIQDSKTETVEDDRESWEQLNKINIRNCRYETITNLTAVDTMWRADLLDREYAPLNCRLRSDPTKHRSTIWSKVMRFYRSLEMLWLGRRGLRSRGRPGDAIKTFEPQPYVQLARVVRRTGYEAAANDIIVRMERNRTRYSGFGRRWVTDALVRYGFSPLRPVWYLLIWTAISAVLFEYGFANRRIVATRENLEQYSEGHSTKGQERYEFNPVIYASAVDRSQSEEELACGTSTFSVSKKIGGAATGLGAGGGWAAARQPSQLALGLLGAVQYLLRLGADDVPGSRCYWRVEVKRTRHA